MTPVLRFGKFLLISSKMRHNETQGSFKMSSIVSEFDASHRKITYLPFSVPFQLLTMSQPPDPLYILRGSGSPVASLKFQNNQVLYSGHHDGKIYAWSMKSRRAVLTVQAHTDFSALWIDFPDDTNMLTQGRDGNLKCWAQSDTDWVEISTTKTSDMGFCRGCLVNRSLVAVPSQAQMQVDLYDLKHMKVVAHLKPDSKKFGMCMGIKSAGSSTEESRLVIGYEDGSIALWDIRTNRLVDSSKLHEDSVMCLEYSKALNKGYSGSANQILSSWLTASGKITPKDSVSITNPGVNDIAARLDGKIVAFGGWDSKLRVFGAKHLKPLAVLDYHKESINCLTFSDDQILACGSKDQLISLWDIYR